MRAFLSLETQFENLGDEVINTILMASLSKRMPVTARVGRSPDWYIQNLKENISNKNNIEFIKSDSFFYFSLAKSAILPGVNWLFTSPGDVTSHGGTSRKQKAMIGLIKMPGIRMANVGSSFSDLSKGHARIIAASLADGRPTIRDRASQGVGSRLGLDLPIVPDLAWSLSRQKSRGSRVLVSARAPTKNTERYFQKLVKIVNSAKSAGFEPLVTWQVARDQEFCRKIATETKSDMREFATRPTWKEAKELFSHCSLVVSNRLHVLLLAAAEGALPIAALPHDEVKVKSVFELEGLEFLINSGDGIPAEFFSNFDINNEKITNVFRKNRESIERYFDSLVAAPR